MKIGENLLQTVRDAPVASDGRGVRLPRDAYSELTPQ